MALTATSGPNQPLSISAMQPGPFETIALVESEIQNASIKATEAYNQFLTEMGRRFQTMTKENAELENKVLAAKECRKKAIKAQAVLNAKNEKMAEEFKKECEALRKRIESLTSINIALRKQNESLKTQYNQLSATLEQHRKNGIYIS